MNNPTPTDTDQVRALAHSLDCMTEGDLCLLAKVAPATAESWRKHGKGPGYILVGTRYLYPRDAVAAYLRSLIRPPRAAVKVSELL